jgi:hypothetical protein
MQRYKVFEVDSVCTWRVKWRGIRIDNNKSQIKNREAAANDECKSVWCVQSLQKVFTHLDFLQMLCYSLHLNGLNLDFFCSLAYTQYPIMSKWKSVFRHFYKWIINEKLKCIESISIQPLCYGLNKFRSKHFLNKSHNKLHGLTLCAIMVFNMIVKWIPHLCTPHTHGLAVNFKHRFNNKDQRGFPMPWKEGHLLVDGYKSLWALCSY